MPIVIWAGQGRDSPLIYFQQKQKYKKGRERPALQAKTVQWTVFSESPSSCAAKAVAASIQSSRSHGIRDRKNERRSKPHIIFNFLIPVKLIGIKTFFPLEHVINRTSKFLRNYAHREFCELLFIKW